VATARGISEIRGWSAFNWVQNSYSLLDRAAEREMLPFCAHEGVGFTAFSPLAGGWLTGKYRADTPYPAGSRMTLRPEPYLHLSSDRVFGGLANLAAAARARDTTMSALALAWVLRHPQVTAAIVGPRSPAHLDQALAALGVTMSPEDADGLAAPFVSSRAHLSAST
jgi:aryl-alcohol dehydrogenase-like predicted oxidoreductase